MERCDKNGTPLGSKTNYVLNKICLPGHTCGARRVLFLPWERTCPVTPAGTRAHGVAQRTATPQNTHGFSARSCPAEKRVGASALSCWRNGMMLPWRLGLEPEPDSLPLMVQSHTAGRRRLYDATTCARLRRAPTGTSDDRTMMAPSTLGWCVAHPRSRPTTTCHDTTTRASSAPRAKMGPPTAQMRSRACHHATAAARPQTVS